MIAPNAMRSPSLKVLNKNAATSATSGPIALCASHPATLSRCGLRRRLIGSANCSTQPTSVRVASARLTFMGCIPISSASSCPAISPSPPSDIMTRSSLRLRPFGSATPSRIGRLIMVAKRSIATSKPMSLVSTGRLVIGHPTFEWPMPLSLSSGWAVRALTLA